MIIKLIAHFYLLVSIPISFGYMVFGSWEVSDPDNGWSWLWAFPIAGGYYNLEVAKQISGNDYYRE